MRDKKRRILKRKLSDEAKGAIACLVLFALAEAALIIANPIVY